MKKYKEGTILMQFLKNTETGEIQELNLLKVLKSRSDSRHIDAKLIVTISKRYRNFSSWCHDGNNVGDNVAIVIDVAEFS